MGGCRRRDRRLWFVTIDHLRVRRHLNVDRDLPDEVAVAIEYLDATIAAIGNVHESGSVHRNAVRRVELSRSAPRRAHVVSQRPSLRPSRRVS